MAAMLVLIVGLRVERRAPARPRRRAQLHRPLRAGDAASLRRRLADIAGGAAALQARKCRSRSRAPSSRATNRRTSPSTARSIPIAAASMAASTASRAPPMPSWACPPGSTSRRSCSPSRTRRSCSSASCPSRATSRVSSPSAPIPIPTSRSRRTWRIMRQMLEVLDKPPTIRSASSPSRRSSCATSTFSPAWRDARPRLGRACRSRRSIASSRAPWSRARPRPPRRLEAIRALSDAGIPTAVMMAPIIPGLNDHEIEQVLDSGKAAGAHGGGLCAPAAAAGGEPALQATGCCATTRIATGTSCRWCAPCATARIMTPSSASA
jgi:hypothetical protein